MDDRYSELQMQLQVSLQCIQGYRFKKLPDCFPPVWFQAEFDEICTKS